MAAEPYTDVTAHVRDELRRVWLRLEYQIRLGWRISENASGLTEDVLGADDMGRLFASAKGTPSTNTDADQLLEQWLAAHEQTEARIRATIEARVRSPLVDVIRTYNLSARQWSSLVFALLGKRTSDVKSSNDRYANLETNYLLQRLERFNGLTILTTNLTGAIDQAFKRRFTYDVYVTFPSPDMRAELWRRTLPAGSVDIDYDALVEKYELTGGFIKVACERAAYVAGANGAQIDDGLLRATIERMYRERGKLSTVGPLE